MTNLMTFTVQIDQFCNCKGCIHKVKKALRKLDDVKLLAMDPDTGEFTISTTKHPEVVKHFLKCEFPNKSIIISQKINRSYPVSVPDVDDIAKALLTMPQVKGLKSVEYTQSSVFKFNFTNPHNQPSGSSLPPMLHNATPPPPPLPQTNIRPSAPPIPTDPDLVYGYPPEFYGFMHHPHDSCAII